MTGQQCSAKCWQLHNPAQQSHWSKMRQCQHLNDWIYSFLFQFTWGHDLRKFLILPLRGEKVPSVGLKLWEHHYRNRSQGPSRWLCPNYLTCTAQWWLIFPVSKENIQMIKEGKPQDTIWSSSRDNLAVLVRWLGWGLSCQVMDRECGFYNYKLYLECHH